MNVEDARRWLEEAGLVQVEGGVWDDDGERLSPNDLAHNCTGSIMGDEDLTPVERVRTAFGLVDLTDEYWVMVEMGWGLAAMSDERAWAAFWAGCRARLEAPEPCQPVEYALWVRWFEDHQTVERAFEEVLGRDVSWLRAEGRRPGAVKDPRFRRADRVLRISGPVPWDLKLPVYQAARTAHALHPAIFQGILTSYHDVYGSLEPEPALDLLERLDLPADTEHFARLRRVLQAGHRNHYKSPDAWRA